MNEEWILFLDDERFPTNPKDRIARNSYDAQWLIEHLGMPQHISFDHDLGGADTAMNLLHWMAGQLIAGNVAFPENFSYSVHSQNPVGAQNIMSMMESLLEEFEL